MSSIGLVDHFDRLQCGLLVFSDTDRLHNCHRHINSLIYAHGDLRNGLHRHRVLHYVCNR